MKRSEAIFGALRVPLDALVACAALLLAYRLREANIDLIPRVQLLDPASTLPPFEQYLRTFVAPGILFFLVLSAMLKLYAWQAVFSAWNEIGRILMASVLWLVGVMAWYFLVEKQLFYSRVLLIHATFFLLLFSVLGRAAMILLQRALLRSGIGVRTVASVGKHPISPSACAVLQHDVRYAYRGHSASLQACIALLEQGEIDLVLQTDPNPESGETMELIDYCRSNHIGYAFLPPVFADVPHQLVVEHLGLLPMMRFQPTPLDGWGRIFKRLFDVCMSGALLLLLSPLLLFLAFVVWCDGGRPIFYVSKRIGAEGRGSIPVLKFRSMVRDADQRKEDLIALNHRSDGPLFKIKEDPRITQSGKVLRRWSLDELPQLLNVLSGHLSLVGPRPHLPEEVRRYTHYQRRVFAVKPGMTGLAQVSGRSDLTFAEEVGLDLKYIEEWSLLLDLWILWRTLVVVLSRRGAD